MKKIFSLFIIFLFKTISSHAQFQIDSSYRTHIMQWPEKITNDRNIIINLQPQYTTYIADGSHFDIKGIMTRIEYKAAENIRLSITQSFSETFKNNSKLISGPHDINISIKGLHNDPNYGILYGLDYALSQKSILNLGSEYDLIDNYSGANSITPILGMKFENQTNTYGFIIGTQRYLSKKVIYVKQSDITNWLEGFEETFLSTFYETNIQNWLVNLNFKFRDFSRSSSTSDATPGIKYTDQYTYSFINLGAMSSYELDSNLLLTSGIEYFQSIKGEVSIKGTIFHVAFKWLL